MKDLAKLAKEIKQLSDESNRNKFVPAFQVYKENITLEWITILIPVLDYSKKSVESKKEFYKQLGYTIK